ncbi:hypothetical protein [Aquimarina celericrescens]|uniref:Polysaccharide chain length determinant N-terminal domain-containing protein n=1 Tax=Aquimarina celericrescens TaxID=1964542 RepID=A0ABW5AWA8_9FLAO
MSHENQNEEIDLMQLFGMVKEFFRKILRLIISVIDFYKKKWLLFFVVVIVGFGVGYFMDQYQDLKDRYVQEIIIEPKYDSTEYIYDFIEDLDDNFADSLYVKKLGLEIEQAKNIKKISLEPIIKPEDVLNQLQNKYGGKESFIEAYDENTLKEKKFRNFYKQHKLTIIFKNKEDINSGVSKSILNYIKSNDYFNELLELELKQVNVSITQNKKSLEFINDYLTNLSQNPAKNDEKFIYASESETPTISSLLKRKQDLIERVKNDEKLVTLDKEVFTVVHYGNIVSKRKILVNRRFFLMPLILVGLVSLIYLLRFLKKAANNFVNNE